jgi:transposase InsO family protein
MLKQFLKTNNLHSNDLDKLHQKPLEEIDLPSYKILKPNVMHQVDVLYLPDDNGRKYLLTLIDVHNSLCSGRALERMDMNYILGSLDDMYEKSPYFEYPNCIQADSQFKTNEMKKWCKFRNINLKIIEPNNHRQNASIERLNQTLGKWIWFIQEKKEIETGKVNTKWLHIYKKIINFLNENRLKQLNKNYERKIEIKDKILLNKNNNKILMKGTKVRLRLEKPESIQGVKYKNDKFRATDIHWQVKPLYEIMESYLILGSPPMYRIKEVNSGKIFRGLVPYERLQVI